jgi:Ser-tRNA(Ala) deacylase AlaX
VHGEIDWDLRGRMDFELETLRQDLVTQIEVRIVEIRGLDLQTDGGTHVANRRIKLEIGD